MLRGILFGCLFIIRDGHLKSHREPGFYRHEGRAVPVVYNQVNEQTILQPSVRKLFAVVERGINLCNQFNCLGQRRNADNKSTISEDQKNSHGFVHPPLKIVLSINLL